MQEPLVSSLTVFFSSCSRGWGLYATTFHCLDQTYEAEGGDVLTPTNSAPVPCDFTSL